MNHSELFYKVDIVVIGSRSIIRRNLKSYRCNIGKKKITRF